MCAHVVQKNYYVKINNEEYKIKICLICDEILSINNDKEYQWKNNYPLDELKTILQIT